MVRALSANQRLDTGKGLKLLVRKARQYFIGEKAAVACIRVCQMLSSYYRNVDLFCLNERSGNIYIFASEELQIFISQDSRYSTSIFSEVQTRGLSPLFTRLDSTSLGRERL